MSLVPSLCAALERTGGERLVMRAGERPHVLTGDRRQDIGSAVLSLLAVEALAEQILSPAGRRALAVMGTVTEAMESAAFPRPLTARAERVGDEFYLELVAARPAGHRQPDAPLSAPPPTPPASGARTETAMTALARVAHAVSAARAAVRTPTGADALIRQALDRSATMLYLRAGTAPAARIDDRIEPLGTDPVDASLLRDLAATFDRGGDGIWRTGTTGEWTRDDSAFGPVVCRLFMDHHGLGAVMQLRPAVAADVVLKRVPRHVRQACEGDGLIVVAAPTDLELDQLVWALANCSAQRHGGYLVSLEPRPILTHDVHGAFVSPRTVTGTDAAFATAIRCACAEGADTLVVLAPSSLAAHEAIAAAAGSRLVIVGVVASTTLDALRVMLGQEFVQGHLAARRGLAASFRGGYAQRTVRRLGGGRVVVQDRLTASDHVRALIDGGDFTALGNLQKNGERGCQSIDAALARAVARGHVSLRQAAAHASDVRAVVARLRREHRRVPRPDAAPASAIERPAALGDERLFERIGATKL